MGFLDTIGGIVGRGLDAYDMYRDVRGAYRDAVPRRTRRAIGNSVGRGFQTAKDYGGRAIGGISGLFKRKQEPREDLVSHLRGNQYDTRGAGRTGRSRFRHEAE
jgi:hypothetical protein